MAKGLTQLYLLKITNFSYPCLIQCPRSRWLPSKLWNSFTVTETRVFQAADDKDLVILACTVFDWSTRVMDGQTDKRTKLRNDQKF